MVDSVQAFFDGLSGTMDPSKLAGMKATFQFVVTGDGGGEWNVVVADGKAAIAAGKAENPSIVLTASTADWLALMNGDLNGQTAFLTGKLKIQGDMTLAMKLESFFKLG